jgi:hypothetical protein
LSSSVTPARALLAGVFRLLFFVPVFNAFHSGPFAFDDSEQPGRRRRLLFPRQVFDGQGVYNAFVQVIKPVTIGAREFGKFAFRVVPELFP